jgi:hypothetical protein
MGRFRQSNRARPVLAAAAIYFCAGLCIASMFLMLARFSPIFDGYWTPIMAVTGSLIFLCACVLVFFQPTVAYLLGALAGGVAVPWFVLTESSFSPSAWAYLNGPDDFGGATARPVAELKILSVALIAVAVTCSIFRLLPTRLLLRISPLSHRTWPALAVAVLVLAVWLQHSARPWMLPTIVDAVFPELQILHVEKRGLQFHETSASFFRNGRFWVTHNDRRLLQYRFQSRSTGGVMPPSLTDRANVLAHSTTLRNLRTASPIALRSWNAEGWYVALGNWDSPLLAFTSDFGTTRPQEIRDLLEQIEKLTATQRQGSFVVEDVCLGFCYDPVAGLGFWYSNQRCHGMPDGTTQCL